MCHIPGTGEINMSVLWPWKPLACVSLCVFVLFCFVFAIPFYFLLYASGFVFQFQFQYT